MKGLILFFASRPVTSIMIMAGISLAAIFSFANLPLDRLPELSIPRVTIETEYPGMTAQEVRSMVTIPAEDAFSSVKGVENIQSVSRDGSSLIKLDFRWGTDPMSASALVREAVDVVYPSLPFGVSKPNVTPGDPDAEPHVIITVKPLIRDNSYALRLADYDLRAKLRRIDGVGSVRIIGGEKNEGHFKLDIPRLTALGYAPSEFASIFSRETMDIPAGSARDGSVELSVVSSGRLGKIEDAGNLMLPAKNTAIFTSDVGEINLETSRKKSIFISDGTELTAIEVFRRPGADPVRLSRDIKNFIADANNQYSNNAEIKIIKDYAPALVKSMTGLIISAGLGIAAVFFVLFLFVRRLKICFLAALSIPFSIAAGICILALSGRTLNSMSLGGLALGIGLVSDVAVIMLELLSRANFCKKPSPSVISEKAASIAGSSISSTLTTAVVFVPVIFLPGPLGSLFGDTSIALVASIFAGWFYSQFFIPSLYLFTFKNFSLNTKKEISFGRKYKKYLLPVFRRPIRWIASAVLVCSLGVFLIIIQPVTFISPDDAQEIIVSVEFAPGTTIESISDYGIALTEILQELTALERVYARAGAQDEETNLRANLDYRREELKIYCIPDHKIKIDKAFGLIKNNMDQIINEKNIVGSLNQTAYSVYLPKDKAEIHLGLSNVMSYAVNGRDTIEVKERSGIILDKLLDDNIKPAKIYPSGKKTEMKIYPNRETLAFFGISAADIAESLYIINEGVIAAYIEEEGQPIDIRISGNKNLPLEEIPVKTPLGKNIFLGSLGSIENIENDYALARLDRSDVIFIDMQPDNELQSKVEKLDSMFSWFFRTDESVFRQYRYSIIMIIFLALILMYMTMGGQFESFLLPVILMLTIPFGLAGIGPALLLFNCNLDSGAILGLCALFGLAVNNGLILFEISEERIKLGFNPLTAVLTGASLRLRPIIITTLTTAMALLPIILNPAGGVQKSMAAAMFGGLAASTCISLFILPPVFVKYFKWRFRYDTALAVPAPQMH